VKQFGVLARRYLDLIRHDKISLWVLLAVMPIIGLFLLLISNGAALVGNTARKSKLSLKRRRLQYRLPRPGVVVHYGSLSQPAGRLCCLV